MRKVVDANVEFVKIAGNLLACQTAFQSGIISYLLVYDYVRNTRVFFNAVALGNRWDIGSETVFKMGLFDGRETDGLLFNVSTKKPYENRFTYNISDPYAVKVINNIPVVAGASHIVGGGPFSCVYVGKICVRFDSFLCPIMINGKSIVAFDGEFLTLRFFDDLSKESWRTRVRCRQLMVNDNFAVLLTHKGDYQRLSFFTGERKNSFPYFHISKCKNYFMSDCGRYGLFLPILTKHKAIFINWDKPSNRSKIIEGVTAGSFHDETLAMGYEDGKYEEVNLVTKECKSYKLDAGKITSIALTDQIAAIGGENGCWILDRW